MFGILGPNGAGNTTTVECLEGLRTPDGGTITVNGLDPQRPPAELKERLGVQLRASELPPKITVAETMRLHASFYRDPADWREPRELDVLRLIAAGVNNRNAAAQLFTSEASVKTHLLHIYAKLGVHDRAAAVAAAFSRGFLTPPTR